MSINTSEAYNHPSIHPLQPLSPKLFLKNNFLHKFRRRGKSNLLRPDIAKLTRISLVWRRSEFNLPISDVRQRRGRESCTLSADAIIRRPWAEYRIWRSINLTRALFISFGTRVGTSTWQTFHQIWIFLL